MRNSYYDYSHFTDEKVKSKVTAFFSSEVRFHLLSRLALESVLLAAIGKCHRRGRPL